MSRILAAAAGLVALNAVPASGQYAQGTGHANDRNQQIGSGGRNNPARADLAAELRFRNAVVTGNAPGGMSFRGDVGYTAPGEFFNSLGSNDLFAFRRDAAYSGLAGMGIRGTDALQYQFAMTTGNRPPPGLTGRLEVSRSGAGAQADDLRQQPQFLQQRAPRPTGPRTFGTADADAGDASDMRSAASFSSMQSLQPSLIGTAPREGGGLYGLSASRLRGLTMELLPQRDGIKPIERTEPLPPGSSAREDLSAAPAVPKTGSDATFPASGPQPKTGDTGPAGANPPGIRPTTPGGADTPSGTGRPAAAGAAAPQPGMYDKPKTAYDDLVDRLNRLTPPTEPTGEGADAPGGSKTSPTGAKPSQAWRSRVDELTRHLDDSKSAAAPGAATGAGSAAAAKDRDRDRGISAPTGPAGPAPTGPKPAPGLSIKPIAPGEGGMPPPPEAVDLIRQAQANVPSFVTSGSGHDPYERHMRRGQELLTQGRYFDAEERFTSALSNRPGDPMAAVGRIHSQLGASMYLSAAINLRTLLVEHPEAAGLKYGADLLPPADRTEKMVGRLRELMADSKQGMPREAGLLMAYLGFQHGKPAIIKEGLDGAAKGGPAGQNDQLQRLAEVLRQVWLAEQKLPEKK